MPLYFYNWFMATVFLGTTYRLTCSRCLMRTRSAAQEELYPRDATNFQARSTLCCYSLTTVITVFGLFPHPNRHLTHLVMHLDSEQRATGRTIKYLHAVMQGCWVVGTQWVEHSLAAGRLLPEGAFEARVRRLGTQHDI